MAKTTTAKTISIENEVISAVEHMAKIENRTFSNMVETLIKRQLKL